MARPVKYRYRAQIIKIINGDLFKMRVDLGMSIFLETKVKLAGVNCLPRDTAGGSVACQYVEGLFANKDFVDIQTLRKVKDSWLTTVWIEGLHLNSHLLEKKLGSEFVAQSSGS